MRFPGINEMVDKSRLLLGTVIKNIATNLRLF